MRYKCLSLFLIFFLSLPLLYRCVSAGEEDENIVESKVPVTITGITTGSLTDYVDLTAISAFLNKSVIQSPAAAYIESIEVNPGDLVKKDQLVLMLKTKEASALLKDSSNSLDFSGLIRIRSAIVGIITNVNHPKGDYVTDGEPLLTTAVPASFVFLLEVPFEMNALLKINSSCEILLSDGEKIPAKIKSRLPIMSGNSQTQKYIVQPGISLNLPENLISKIRIIRKVSPKAQILPKSCVLTDEVMKNFWVMKLISDTIAVKIPVKTGLSDEENIEISDPFFTKSDRFLMTGNYGLGDTAKVVVTNKLK
jgi:hypothetical protein